MGASASDKTSPAATGNSATNTGRDSGQGESSKFNGVIKTDIRDSKPDWAPFTPKKAPEGAPNFLFVLYDDTGLAAWSPYGGGINMPTMDKLAANGLTYTNRPAFWQQWSWFGCRRRVSKARVRNLRQLKKLQPVAFRRVLLKNRGSITPDATLGDLLLNPVILNQGHEIRPAPLAKSKPYWLTPMSLGVANRQLLQDSVRASRQYDMTIANNRERAMRKGIWLEMPEAFAAVHIQGNNAPLKRDN